MGANASSVQQNQNAYSAMSSSRSEYDDECIGGEGDHLVSSSAAAGGSSSSSSTTILHLTPTQSCSLHGWSNPKRTLSWDDVARNPRITLQKCLQEVPCIVLFFR